MSNRGGGARWHLMTRAACENCGLVAPRGVHQIAKGHVRCADRSRCEARRLAKQAATGTGPKKPHKMRDGT